MRVSGAEGPTTPLFRHRVPYSAAGGSARAQILLVAVIPVSLATIAFAMSGAISWMAAIALALARRDALFGLDQRRCGLCFVAGAFPIELAQKLLPHPFREGGRLGLGLGNCALVVGKSALRLAFQLLGAILVGGDSIAATFHYLFDAR